MLDVCSVTSRSLSLNVNCSKSFCIKFGPLSKYDTSDMFLCGNKITWADSIKYLGIIFISGKQLWTDDGVIKRKLYTACNCLFVNCRNQQQLFTTSVACQYLLIVLLLWNYLLFKPQILMLVGTLYSAKFLVFINGNQSVVLLVVWVNLILSTFVWNLC